MRLEKKGRCCLALLGNKVISGHSGIQGFEGVRLIF